MTVAAGVRALVITRGAERAVRMMGLSPLALAALCAGGFVQAETLRRARHFLATGSPLPRPPPPKRAEPVPARALSPPPAPPVSTVVDSGNVIPLRGLRPRGTSPI